MIYRTIRQKNLGRPSKRVEISKRKARQLAHQKLTGNEISFDQLFSIETLTVVGVVTHKQLSETSKISETTISRYLKSQILDRIPADPNQLRYFFPALATSDLRVYTLGVLGREIARLHFGDKSLAGRVPDQRVLHDLCVSEICIALTRLFSDSGYEAEWESGYSATLYGAQGDVLLAPDALIRLTMGDEQKCFVLEFNPEPTDKIRIMKKIDRYDMIRRQGVYCGQWKTGKFPTVLWVYYHTSAGQAFHDYIDTHISARAVTFLSRPWKACVHGYPDIGYSSFNLWQGTNNKTHCEFLLP